MSAGGMILTRPGGASGSSIYAGTLRLLSFSSGDGSMLVSFGCRTVMRHKSDDGGMVSGRMVAEWVCRSSLDVNAFKSCDSCSEALSVSEYCNEQSGTKEKSDSGVLT